MGVSFTKIVVNLFLLINLIPFFNTFPQTLADFGIHLNPKRALLGSIPKNITYVDLNHDNIRDVVVQKESSLEIYMGRIGSFPPQPDFTIKFQHSINSVDWAYCNKNCVYPDLHVTLNNGKTEIWKNIWEKQLFGQSLTKALSSATSLKNDIEFTEVWRSPEFAGGATYMWAGDLDGDGSMEIAVQTFPNGDANYDVATIHVFKSTGDNTYQEVWNTTGDFGALDLKFGDVDGNGQKEIIIANGRTIKLWESIGGNQFQFYETNANFTDPSVEQQFRTYELAVTDIDQDGIKEITRLHSASGNVPGPNTIITIDEFVAKYPEQNLMLFNQIYRLTDLPFDGDFAAGDIDNDGTQEILVGGAFSFDLTYFDYDIFTKTFVSKDIITWLHSTGKNPRIFDVDQDGLNEILESGGNPLSQKGSLFILKSIQSDSFKVIWHDSTSRFGDSLTMEVGYLNDFPASVIATQVLIPNFFDKVEADIFLFSPGYFQHVWTSPRQDSSFMRSVLLLDMDKDNKENVIFSLTGPIHHLIFDFEEAFTSDVSVFKHKIPSSFKLYQNYPNPFNTQTSIEYVLFSKEKVKLIIYNIQGENIIILVNQLQEPGNYKIMWDGKDNQGKTVSSGIYLYQLKIGRFENIKKMLLLR